MKAYHQIIITILTFLFALLAKPILGQLIDPLINSYQKLVLAGVVLLIIGAIISFNLFIVLLRKDDKTHKDLETIQESIYQRLGLTADFICSNKLKTGTDSHSIVIKLVNMAKGEIIVIDHWPSHSSSGALTGHKLKSREKYYEILTEKALSKTKEGRFFKYKRIIQLEDGPTNIWNNLNNNDTLFCEHCRKIVDNINTNPGAMSSIKTSRVFFPKASIVIVDGRHVLIELTMFGTMGQIKVGDIVFDDIDGKLAKPLIEFFEHIDAQSTMITEII